MLRRRPVPSNAIVSPRTLRTHLLRSTGAVGGLLRPPLVPGRTCLRRGIQRAALFVCGPVLGRCLCYPTREWQYWRGLSACERFWRDGTEMPGGTGRRRSKPAFSPGGAPECTVRATPRERPAQPSRQYEVSAPCGERRAALLVSKRLQEAAAGGPRCRKL